jgi:nucleotidyltransferase substrate binding protein (TIGR01987 family)
MAKDNNELREQFRSASIQSFEYTYELCIKMIRRQLERIAANPAGLREMEFMDLVRTAYEAGIVENPVSFKLYREMRNITSHTYDGDKAEEIISVTGPFLKEVRFVLDQIKTRNK